MLNLHNVPTL